MSISVCMAAYNGASFIKEQIDSILAQLGFDDELIVVDDCSTDDTVLILNNYVDARIKIYVNKENLGHVKTFEKAISNAIGQIIFLSDQDDVWCPGRVSAMCAALQQHGYMFVASNFNEFTEVVESEAVLQRNRPMLTNSSSFFMNIICIFLGLRPYYGCAMAFDKRAVPLILPIPDFVESHDIWIAFAGNLKRSICNLDQVTLYRRIHARNLTAKKPRSLSKIIKTRIGFVRYIVELIIRYKKI